MTLNILLTAFIFYMLFFAISHTVDARVVSNRVAVVVTMGYLISAATIVITALVLVWTR
jgi:hypothetical protein